MQCFIRVFMHVNLPTGPYIFLYATSLNLVEKYSQFNFWGLLLQEKFVNHVRNTFLTFIKTFILNY